MAQRDWLRDLARTLSHCDADADDLTQDAYAAALTDPGDAIRSPRAWLASVTRHLAFGVHKSERARTDRERALPVRDAAQATDQAVANTEVYALLSNLVLALDEPYRTVVMLRFYEGQSAAQIARGLNVPASTVRTRLSRALTQLRANLEERDPEDRWLSCLAPIMFATDGVKRVVLMIGFVALFGAIGLGVFFAGRGGPPTAPPIVSTEDVLVADSEDEASPLPELAAVTSQRTGVAPVPPVAPVAVEQSARAKEAPDVAIPVGTLEVLVTVDGVPRTSGTVVLDSRGPTRGGIPSPELKPNGTLMGTERELDSNGLATFDSIAPGTWWIAVSLDRNHLAQQAVTIKEESGERVHVALLSSAVYGAAYDEDGNPLPDRWVALSPLIGGTSWQIGRTDALGEYRFEFVTPGLTWVVLYPGKSFGRGRSSYPMEKINVPREGDLRHDFGSAAGLRHFAGRVLTTGGEPIVGALTLHLTDQEGGGYVAVRTEPGTGAFDKRLRSGAWNVKIDDESQGQKRDLIFELELGDHDVTEDLTLPGTRVVVEVSGVTDPERTFVGLRRKLGVGAPSYRASLVEGGAWVIDGVRPGEWYLVASTRDGGRAEPILLLVEETDQQLTERMALSGG